MAAAAVADAAAVPGMAAATVAMPDTVAAMVATVTAATADTGLMEMEVMDIEQQQKQKQGLDKCFVQNIKAGKELQHA